MHAKKINMKNDCNLNRWQCKLHKHTTHKTNCCHNSRLYAPKTAKSIRLLWLRFGSFMCVAIYFKWDFIKTHMLLSHYYYHLGQRHINRIFTHTRGVNRSEQQAELIKVYIWQKQSHSCVTNHTILSWSSFWGQESPSTESPFNKYRNWCDLYYSFACIYRLIFFCVCTKRRWVGKSMLSGY